MKISIAIPVYHEQDNILKVMAELDEKVKTPNERVIVYDMEEDPTCDVVRKFIKDNKRKDIKLVRNNVGSGRGALNAVKTGLQSGNNKATIVVMADMSDDASMIDVMVKEYEKGAKVVCASRYMKGGREIGGPLVKRTLSRIAGLSLYYLRRMPVHDPTNNFRLYDTELLHSMTIESTAGFEIAMEITVKAHKSGHKVVEVPVTWYDRTAGESRFRVWQWLPSYLKWYFLALRPGKITLTPPNKSTSAEENASS